MKILIEESVLRQALDALEMAGNGHTSVIHCRMAFDNLTTAIEQMEKSAQPVILSPTGGAGGSNCYTFTCGSGGVHTLIVSQTCGGGGGSDTTLQAPIRDEDGNYVLSDPRELLVESNVGGNE